MEKGPHAASLPFTPAVSLNSASDDASSSSTSSTVITADDADVETPSVALGGDSDERQYQGKPRTKLATRSGSGGVPKLMINHARIRGGAGSSARSTPTSMATAPILSAPARHTDALEYWEYASMLKRRTYPECPTCAVNDFVMPFSTAGDGCFICCNQRDESGRMRYCGYAWTTKMGVKSCKDMRDLERFATVAATVAATPVSSSSSPVTYGKRDKDKDFNDSHMITTTTATTGTTRLSGSLATLAKAAIKEYQKKEKQEKKKKHEKKQGGKETEKEKKKRKKKGGAKEEKEECVSMNVHLERRLGKLGIVCYDCGAFYAYDLLKTGEGDDTASGSDAEEREARWHDAHRRHPISPFVIVAHRRAAAAASAEHTPPVPRLALDTRGKHTSAAAEAAAAAADVSTEE